MMLPLLLPALAAAGGWCPRFHAIANHYDPSGPILVDGLWHVFPDGCCTSSNALGCWCHYTSTPRQDRRLIRNDYFWAVFSRFCVPGGRKT